MACQNGLLRLIRLTLTLECFYLTLRNAGSEQGKIIREHKKPIFFPSSNFSQDFHSFKGSDKRAGRLMSDVKSSCYIVGTHYWLGIEFSQECLSLGSSFTKL